MRNMAFIILTALVTTIIAFVIGASLGAKYSITREMQLHEEVLVQNLTILADCKIHQCDKNLQRILIQENDSALTQYTGLEEDSRKNFFVYLGHGAWSVLFSIYTPSDSAMSSERLRKYYKNLGCGLNSVLCQPK